MSKLEGAVETWEHAGLPCALKETPVGFGFGGVGGPANGYVNVPPGHTCAGMDYDDVAVDVHGGLTYAQDQSDGSTWFGWDDCHYVRCQTSAREETNRLAEQLAELG